MNGILDLQVYGTSFKFIEPTPQISQKYSFLITCFIYECTPTNIST